MGDSEVLIKQVADALFAIFHESDETRQITFDLTDAVTGKKLRIHAKQTTDRDIDFPDKDGVLELVNSVRKPLSGTTIDWINDEILVVTLTVDTNLLINGVLQGKVMLLEVHPNQHTLTLPGYVKVIAGKYRRDVVNYIYLHCVEDTTPVFLATINQQIG
jgi:hypothetical protein